VICSIAIHDGRNLQGEETMNVFEDYVNSAPPDQRDRRRAQIAHSFSRFTLAGPFLAGVYKPFNGERENVLQSLMAMKSRFVVDTNSNWKDEANHPDNRDTAFVVTDTYEDENAKLSAIYFGSHAPWMNQNVFSFGLEDYGDALEFMLHRADKEFASIFDVVALDAESKMPADRGQAGQIADEKRRILDIFNAKDTNGLPDWRTRDKACEQLERGIRAFAPFCLLNLRLASETAEQCYARLLLDKDFGNTTKFDFNRSNYPNVFGDMRLIQSALLLQANILSDDGAVKKMVSFIGSPEITAKPRLAIQLPK
jgi:hypothetical protein